MKTFILFLLIVSLQNVLADKNGYDFKKGYWHIEAKTLNEDMTFSKGSGTGVVYQNKVGLLQDNLCIDMDGVPDVIGTTLRTFDNQSNQWYVKWMAYGIPSGSGAGNAEVFNGSVVESFDGKDDHGEFVDQMNFTVHSKDHYTANLSRTYKNGGYKLDCIWCYEAKRSKSKLDKECSLVN